MSDQDQTDHEDLRMARAVGRGVIVGLPIALVGLTIVVRLITGQDLPDSIATSLLPGTLLGVFFGGFVGMVRTMGD